jgi:hypothetical protein
VIAPGRGHVRTLVLHAWRRSCHVPLVSMDLSMLYDVRQRVPLVRCGQPPFALPFVLQVFSILQLCVSHVPFPLPAQLWKRAFETKLDCLRLCALFSLRQTFVHRHERKSC